MELVRCFALLAALTALSGATSQAIDAATIAVGSIHTCAIGEYEREVRCWGYSDDGRLGNGTDREVDRAAPWPISTAVPAWRAVAAGDSHSCGIALSGHVYCWGYNGNGELGDGTTVNRSSPVLVVGLGSEVAQISVGLNHSCALMRSGRINCWGYGATGQLGSGQSSNQTTPGEVSGIVDAIAVAAGGEHTCALFGDGTVKCWGRNNHRQIGDGNTANRYTPVFASTGLNAVELAIGGYHSCARSAAGEVRCWGLNGDGELGTGNVVAQDSHVGVTGLSSGVSRIVADTYHTCALVPPATLKCWGWNYYGQIGNGTTANAVTTPTNVVGLTVPVIEFSAGQFHTCLRSTGNRIFCWGDNYYGEIGFGIPAGALQTVNAPQRISGEPPWLYRRLRIVSHAVMADSRFAA